MQHPQPISTNRSLRILYKVCWPRDVVFDNFYFILFIYFENTMTVESVVRIRLDICIQRVTRMTSE